MSFFEKVPLAPPDPILGLTAAFQNDERKAKVNLGVGLYKTEDLRTPVLGCVKSAEAALLDTEKSKEYLPIDGEKQYLEQMGALVFGKQSWNKEKVRIASFQTVGGTGALKTGGTFLKEEADRSIWISTPTWPNHRGVFFHCGLKVEQYPYYDSKSHAADFDKMAACFEKLQPGTVVLLHASCHNPTGCDPSNEQWAAICELFKAKKLIPFFDFAYQGFGRGIEEDAEAIRYFLNQGLEMFVAVSNAKNLSLYGERVGCLFIVSESSKIAEHILSRVKQMIRTNYSNPPMHGAKIAACIFSTSSLRQKWEDELTEMRERINAMRALLEQQLSAESKRVDFSHLKRGRGMFGFSGLDKSQVDRITAEFGIYMPSDGRINVCGLNRSNIDYVVNAIISVTS
ncbi:MAG: aspartate/tyrosine/aromatic aminotransferase [Verrucomicrobia bacterium]|nr:aspartate/tyrosine/aromatic aminotransferase [Verrucomicrobiota bacterium]